MFVLYSSTEGWHINLPTLYAQNDLTSLYVAPKKYRKSTHTANTQALHLLRYIAQMYGMFNAIICIY